MSFRPEPPYRHGQRDRIALVLVNLGTPDAPTAPALRRYLAEFLGDPRVVEIPRTAWWPILHGVILRTRPAKSAAKYATVWSPQGSPLAVWTEAQAKGVEARLHAAGHDVLVRHAMRYGNPALPAVLDALRAEGATRIAVLPLYPQYAAATTASVHDAVMRWGLGARRLPELRLVSDWADDAGYIAALAGRVRAHWQAHGRAEKLLLSFHGLPERSLHLGDPYHCQCRKTARLLAAALGLADDEVLVTFQSRFGRARWLQPYTEPTLRELAAKGLRSVDAMCPGFVGDCLETLEEIAQEARDAFLESGGERFGYIPCLNDDPAWLDALTAVAERQLQGWPTRAADAAADGRTTAGAAEPEVQRRLALALGAAD